MAFWRLSIDYRHTAQTTGRQTAPHTGLAPLSRRRSVIYPGSPHCGLRTPSAIEEGFRAAWPALRVIDSGAQPSHSFSDEPEQQYCFVHVAREPLPIASPPCAAATLKRSLQVPQLTDLLPCCALAYCFAQSTSARPSIPQPLASSRPPPSTPYRCKLPAHPIYRIFACARC
ncbi:hypothetical protein K458DRAFT_423089 [Lentithecium fluviatile CBS 122367]|uniref:Uncharacterized protein n=1 Tax=Lentithecium fluviatile CBS 122367 TaxID=1168545 RepID=A0A6G1IJS4_9PLEO|nr:hypothetical protein K458DRAFT_423089 [Lentithecium fluviatile CBS 122367]